MANVKIVWTGGYWAFQSSISQLRRGKALVEGVDDYIVAIDDFESGFRVGLILI